MVMNAVKIHETALISLAEKKDSSMCRCQHISNKASKKNYTITTQLLLNISCAVYCPKHIYTYLLPATRNGEELLSL
jgi:hypothetical protein